MHSFCNAEMIPEENGPSTPTVHYHIDIMLSARVIRVEHSGRETKCYIHEETTAIKRWEQGDSEWIETTGFSRWPSIEDQQAA